MYSVLRQKSYTHYQQSLVVRDLEKFREGTPTSREVIGVHTLNFRPNFKFSRLKLCLCGVRYVALINL